MAGKVFSILRGIAYLVSIAAVIAAQWNFNHLPNFPYTSGMVWWRNGWTYMGIGLLACFVWQFRQRLDDQLRPTEPQWGWTPNRGRLLGGIGVIVVSIGWAGYATWALSLNYEPNFDFFWLTWLGATILMSVGFRLCQVRLRPPELPMAAWEWAVLAGCLAIGIFFHLGGIHEFPPPDAVSQIEELQTGNFGTAYLNGSRNRWEFASWALVAALAIKLGGPSMVSVRIGFAALNILKVIPAYFLFRSFGGRVAAVCGTILLAVSGWDTILIRVPANPEHSLTMLGFAIMAGSAVRGSWAAYPWLGFLSGILSWSYLPFRPFIGFALAGAALSGWAHPATAISTRIRRAAAGVLIVAAFTFAIFYPLTHKLAGRFMHEYLDGWNRAYAQQGYYTPNDTWDRTLAKRWDRTVRIANLFYSLGDDNPTHNPDARPTIDPLTGGMVLFGVAYALIRWSQPFYMVTLGAMAVTIFGTLIATGNIDCLRGQAAINYVYMVAAIGIGAVVAGAQASFGKLGRNIVTGLLAVGVGYSVVWNYDLLYDLRTSPLTREHYRNDIAYLSDWLRRTASGFYTIGLVPSGANVIFMDNDGSWLRGKDVRGESTWDIDTTWNKIAMQKERFMLLIAAPQMNREILDYLEKMLPGTKFTVREESTVHGVRMGYSFLTPGEIDLKSERFLQARCTGAHARWTFRLKDGSVGDSVSLVVPFIDHATWPGEIRLKSYRDAEKLDHIEASWEADFTVPEDEAGTYTLTVAPYEGTVTSLLDGKSVSNDLVHLSAGPHHFETRGNFHPAAIEDSMRLSWKKDGGPPRLFPFYRFGKPDPACIAALQAPPPPPAPEPQS